MGNADVEEEMPRLTRLSGPLDEACDRLAVLASDSGRFSVTASRRRVHPKLRKAQTMPGGEIGEIVSLQRV